MPAQGTLDVAIVSLGSTGGLRRADEALADALRRAGASVAIARALEPAEVRTLMLTDLAWARVARRAIRSTLQGLGGGAPRAIVYSSTTAALLWPRPGAIRFDAPAAGNRRGRHGLWQRPLERLRMARASLLLPWSEGGLEEVPARARRGDRALVLPVPVQPSGPPAERDIAAVTYAANPLKKGLDRVLAAWRALPRERGDELLVAGASAEALLGAGFDLDGEDGVRVVGALAPAEYRAILRRARVFVCAPRREDYDIAQLEALADGCQLVTTAAPGPYAALSIARRLDARLVGEDLAGSLAGALSSPSPGYAERAAALLAPYSPAAVDAIVSEQLLPRLLD
jgi:glycosyl transferase family 1